MASYVPPGTETIEVTYRAEGAGFITGGTASISRQFRILDQDNSQELVAIVIAEAVGDGWTHKGDGSLCKSLEPGDASMRVELREGSNPNDQVGIQLSIWMSFPRGTKVSCP